MNALKPTLLTAMSAALLLTALMGASQSPDVPLSDTRLTVHALVREDIFAGWLENDQERLARGEKNVEILMQQRPAAKADLLAWKGGTAMYRAARALETKDDKAFKQKFQEAREFFAQARKLAPEGGGVNAIIGGSYLLWGDRLPKSHRAGAWQQAYDAYQILWKQQSGIIDSLPVHLKGEVLGGLAQSSLRTGRTQEAGKYLDRILVTLRDTPYEPIAKRWKENPKAAEKSSLVCLSCHEDGRLTPRLKALDKKEL